MNYKKLKLSSGVWFCGGMYLSLHRTIHQIFIGFLEITTIKMATSVAVTCHWSLNNKITFIKPECTNWFVNTFYIGTAGFCLLACLLVLVS